MFGHWAVGHLNNGSMCHCLLSNDAFGISAAKMYNNTNQTHESPLSDATNSSHPIAELLSNSVSASSHSSGPKAVTSPLFKKSRSDNDLGLMVDGGAPYSAIYVSELSLVNLWLKQSSSANLICLP